MVSGQSFNSNSLSLAARHAVSKPPLHPPARPRGETSIRKGLRLVSLVSPSIDRAVLHSACGFRSGRLFEFRDHVHYYLLNICRYRRPHVAVSHAPHSAYLLTKGSSLRLRLPLSCIIQQRPRPFGRYAMSATDPLYCAAAVASRPNSIQRTAAGAEAQLVGARPQQRIRPRAALLFSPEFSSTHLCFQVTFPKILLGKATICSANQFWKDTHPGPSNEFPRTRCQT